MGASEAASGLSPDPRTFIAGHRGIVGSAIIRRLTAGSDQRESPVRGETFVTRKKITRAIVEALLGDPSKARRKLDWMPKVSFDEPVREMVDANRTPAQRDNFVRKAGFKAYDPRGQASTSAPPSL